MPWLTLLSYSGTQWQVEASAGPIYLARWQDNEWRALAAFVGDGATYRLDWQNPKSGEYVALDSSGRISDSLVVVDRISRG